MRLRGEHAPLGREQMERAICPGIDRHSACQQYPPFQQCAPWHVHCRSGCRRAPANAAQGSSGSPARRSPRSAPAPSLCGDGMGRFAAQQVCAFVRPVHDFASRSSQSVRDFVPQPRPGDGRPDPPDEPAAFQRRIVEVRRARSAYRCVPALPFAHAETLRCGMAASRATTIRRARTHMHFSGIDHRPAAMARITMASA